VAAAVTAETARAVRLFRFSILYLFALSSRSGSSGAGRANARGVRAGGGVLIALSAHSMGQLPVRAEPLVPQVLVRRRRVDEVEYRFVNPSHAPGRVPGGPPHHARDGRHHVPQAGVLLLLAAEARARRVADDAGGNSVVDPALPDSVHALVLDYRCSSSPARRADPLSCPEFRLPHSGQARLDPLAHAHDAFVVLA
jgi:hypothetical protein